MDEPEFPSPGVSTSGSSAVSDMRSDKLCEQSNADIEYIDVLEAERAHERKLKRECNYKALSKEFGIPLEEIRKCLGNV